MPEKPENSSHPDAAARSEPLLRSAAHVPVPPSHATPPPVAKTAPEPAPPRLLRPAPAERPERETKPTLTDSPATDTAAESAEAVDPAVLAVGRPPDTASQMPTQESGLSSRLRRAAGDMLRIADEVDRLTEFLGQRGLVEAESAGDEQSQLERLVLAAQRRRGGGGGGRLGRYSQLVELMYGLGDR